MGRNVQEHADSVTVLVESLHAAEARQVLDLGCGDGRIAQVLLAKGFQVTGIDPFSDALEQARQCAPQGRFVCAEAQSLPADLTGFDAAFFVNALHHVPVTQMRMALRSALAAVRPGGVVLVIEPLAQGSFFRAMRPVEDETDIRAEASRAIEAMVSDGEATLLDLRRWNRDTRFGGLDDFVDYLSRASSQRAALAAQNATALARAWRDNIRSDDGKAVLIQPMVCWTLTAPSPRSSVAPR